MDVAVGLGDDVGVAVGDGRSVAVGRGVAVAATTEAGVAATRVAATAPPEGVSGAPQPASSAQVNSSPLITTEVTPVLVRMSVPRERIVEQPDYRPTHDTDGRVVDT